MPQRHRDPPRLEGFAWAHGLARSLAIVGCTAGSALPTSAAPVSAEEPAVTAKSRYLLGGVLNYAPEYQGSDRLASRLRPLWAYQYGRFRISTSRASAVLGFASDAPSPGASAELLSTGRWRLGAALRFDSGRRSSDSPYLAGLPDIPRTLRGRVYASYSITDHWGTSGGVSQDLLGHGGGALGILDIGYRQWLGARIEWTTGVGVSAGTARYMKTYFGITESHAAQTSQRAFEPGAGLKDLHAGTGLTTALSRHWVAFANLGASRLVGDAAASPLTRSATSLGASIGLAYRCCN